MKNNYWTEIEDNLCLEYIQSTSYKRKVEIYNKLYNKIMYMICSITKSYFNFKHTELDDIRNEVLSHVFLNLKHYKRNFEAKNRFYSYISTLIKNYCLTYVRSKYYRNQNSNEFEYIDNYENKLVDTETINLKEKAIEFLIEKRDNLILNLKKDKGNISEFHYNKRKNEIKFIKYLIDFIKNYNNFNTIDLAVYFNNNYTGEFTRNEIITFINKHLNVRIPFNVFYDNKNLNNN
ncbi:MAG: hypothetical protein ACOC2W_01480 [bacterium]